jgi:hypothetical protein
MQAISFVDTRSVEYHKRAKECGTPNVQGMSSRFTSEEARIYWELVMRRLMHFISSAIETRPSPTTKSPKQSETTSRGNKLKPPLIALRRDHRISRSANAHRRNHALVLRIRSHLPPTTLLSSTQRFRRRSRAPTSLQSRLYSPLLYPLQDPNGLRGLPVRIQRDRGPR